MKILILYHSMTGNTEKIARAIYEESKKSGEADICRIEEASGMNLHNYRVIFIGSPCHAGDISAQVKKWLTDLPEPFPPRIAAFITHASPAYKKEDFQNSLASVQKLCSEKNIVYSGSFDCQGFLTPELHDFIRKSRNISEGEWEQMVEKMTGHPDENDMEAARNFCRMILKS
ncbi:MAG TPA: flavodoxin family protein [Spirochaetota bacterium]|nr:flavodoxin family protein [Spirochaetota bacterium]HPI88360.1 flavodoxin family protein [Spirochaetota bacterium]HPR46782.1 flavodoxin family protein [Spirochaetota bacterium]